MKRATCLLPFTAVIVALVLSSCVPPTPPDIPIEVPELGDVIDQKPAITTGLSDAVTAVPFLDGYRPGGTSPMSLLPRTRDGAFELTHSGHFAFEAKSYCLAHGKCSPGSDHGAMYAPLRGARADIVRSVLCRAGEHPEIPQSDIQTLLWAITSRTRIKDLSPETRQAGDKLLTPSEIRRLNGGALGLIPDEVMDEAIDKLPPEAQQVFEAEAQLREMLSSAESTYEELERVAVALDRPSGEETVPRGRWSFHPDGYFIRYCPHGFSRTLITLYVPERFRIKRDDKGRITSLADRHGNVIVTEYDDTIEPMTVPGEPDLRAYAFRSIHFVRLDASKAGKTEFCPLITTLADMLLLSEWKDTGWVFCGVPGGRGRPVAGSGRFADLEDRYEWSKAHRKELHDLVEGLHKLGGPCAQASISDKGMGEIMSLAHYAHAIEQAVGRSPTDGENQIEGPADVVKRAWQSAVCAQLAPARSRHASISLYRPDGIRIGSTGAPCACPPPFIEGLLTTSILGQTGGSGGHGSFNPGGGSHASGSGDQPVGDSNDGSAMDTSCAKAYRKEINEALDRYAECTARCLMMESFDESWACCLNCEANLEAEKALARKRAQECLEQ